MHIWSSPPRYNLPLVPNQPATFKSSPSSPLTEIARWAHSGALYISEKFSIGPDAVRVTAARIDYLHVYMATSVVCTLDSAHGGDWDSKIDWFEDSRG